MASSNLPLRHNKVISTIVYHDIFDYPLTQKELYKWQTTLIFKKNYKIKKSGDYYFLFGRQHLIQERKKRRAFSRRKLQIARNASLILAKIPLLLFVGITGSLAMQNAKKDSDIDLMFITKKGTMWSTRIAVFILLSLLGHNLRRQGDKDEKNKLCLNIWMDESDLLISDQNIFTAHEIAQIIPLVNKNQTYEKLLGQNSWLKSFWPNAVSFKKVSSSKKSRGLGILEAIAWHSQYFYMKPKITNEKVSRTRAFFHPFDWGEKILKELGKTK